jgi:hypothetical protein
MMMVRAKFKVDAIENTKYGKTGKVLTTIKMTPVYPGENPTHENKKFWDASPSGELRLGTVNAKAVEYFELGEEYYIDFTKAE